LSNLSHEEGLWGIHRLSFRQHREEIRDIWLELQSKSAHSFFTSWGWMEVWLESLPPRIAVDLVVIYSDDKPICCFFLGIGSGLQHGLFYKTCAYLNQAGDEKIDDLVIEYNSALGSIGKVAWAKLLADPIFSKIEEFFFSNITESAFADIDVGEKFEIKVSKKTPSYYVDLAAIRESDRSFSDFLSTNKRSQLKKSLAYYDDGNAVKVREAANVEEALVFLDKLKRLHQSRWVEQGKPGAFASSYFTGFHVNLIKNRFASGEIQILEVSNSSKAIGYLYNFIQDGKVFFYQSGFLYESGSAARPGIVCHYLAIEHNLAMGKDVYNFLAGDAQYKRSLSTHHDHLHTVVAVRSNFKWLVERGLRAVKKALSA